MITFNKKNKKGQFGIIIFFVAIFTILLIGFIAVMAMSIIDLASDTITPVMLELGNVGNANVSQAAEFTVGKVDTIVQSLPLIMAFCYVVLILMSVVFVIFYPENSHPAFIGFYVFMILLFILFSIVVSNMYQDIYEGTDEIATRLQDQTMMSFFILRSPFIFSLIAFLTGIYIFARADNGGGSSGI